MTGLPKKYIKKYGVSKAAWAAYRKDHKPKKRNPSPVKIKGKGRSMSKRKSSKKRLPVFASAGVVIYGYNAAKNSILQPTYTTQQKFDYGITNLTGVRVGSATPAGAGIAWDTALFTNTWLPPAAGVAGSVLADKFKVNKYVRRIPYIGDYLKL